MASDLDLYTLQAEAAALQGDGAAARQYAARAEETAIRFGHRLYQAIAARAWGAAFRLAGDYPQSGDRLRAALQLFVELDTRWQAGRTYVELAELALANRNAAEARQYWGRALALFEELHAAPDAARTRAALAELEVSD